MSRSEKEERAPGTGTSTGRLRSEFTKYLLVGGIAFIFDFGVLVLLTESFSIHYLVSATAGFVVGLTINYTLSVNWVFETRRLEGHRKSEFAIFAIVGGAGLGLNDLTIWFFTSFVGLHYTISKIITTGIVLLWNFLVRKYLLFR